MTRHVMLAALCGFLFITTVLPSQAEFFTGAQLEEYCRHDDGVCHGYVAGVVAESVSTNLLLSAYVGTDPPFCIPDGVILRQAKEVVGRYLADHPERWHEDAHYLVVSALKEAFPCAPLHQ